MTYDEGKIAALIGASTKTVTINKGDRKNGGVPGEIKEFENSGIIVGLVGPRMNKDHVMESQELRVTEDQNTKENGYGENAKNNSILKLFANFYGLEYLPKFTSLKKYYEVTGNLSYAFGELTNAKSFFEKVGDKESVAKIEKYLKGNTNDSIDYASASDNEKISDTAQIESSLDLVKMMDEERNKTLQSLGKKPIKKRKTKKVKRKKNQPTKKNAKRPVLNVEDDY